MRYEVDFAIYFVVPALLLWCVAIAAYQPGDWRRSLLVTAFVLTLSATVVTGSALSITGATDDLKYGNPETWLFLSDLFMPVRAVIEGLP
jgi:hypothetical protein